MAKSWQTLVHDCCQLLTQDLTDLSARAGENSAHSQAPKVIAREAALDCFLEIAVICCAEEQPWISRKLPLSETFAGNHITQKMIRGRQFLQAECPLLSPFFLFQNASLSETILNKVYLSLKESITPEEWRTEHILGWIYQYALQGTPGQKLHGQFYTSEAIVDYIVSQTFAWRSMNTSYLLRFRSWIWPVGPEALHSRSLSNYIGGILKQDPEIFQHIRCVTSWKPRSFWLITIHVRAELRPLICF